VERDGHAAASCEGCSRVCKAPVSSLLLTCWQRLAAGVPARRQAGGRGRTISTGASGSAAGAAGSASSLAAAAASRISASVSSGAAAADVCRPPLVSAVWSRGPGSVSGREAGVCTCKLYVPAANQALAAPWSSAGWPARERGSLGSAPTQHKAAALSNLARGAPSEPARLVSEVAVPCPLGVQVLLGL